MCSSSRAALTDIYFIGLGGGKPKVKGLAGSVPGKGPLVRGQATFSSSPSVGGEQAEEVRSLRPLL